MAQQINTQQQSPFFKLPAELRIIIYRLGLLRPRGDVKIGALDGPNRILQPQLTAIPLLQACRRTHEEALPILYGENNFRFYVARHGLDFLQAIGPLARQAMRGVSVCFGDARPRQSTPQDAFFELLVRSIKVERLRLQVSLWDFYRFRDQCSDEPVKWHPLAALEGVKEAVVDTDWMCDTFYGDVWQGYVSDVDEESGHLERTIEVFEEFMDKLEAVLLRNSTEKR